VRIVPDRDAVHASAVAADILQSPADRGLLVRRVVDDAAMVGEPSDQCTERSKFPKFTPMGYAPKSAFNEALAAAGYATNEADALPTVPANDELSDAFPF